MKFIVYRHTNTTSGKSYIGWTKLTMMERWNGHVRLAMRGGRWLFHEAIRDHGVETWVHEVLEVHDTSEAAKSAEIRLIAEYKTCAPDGYNMTLGGEGMFGFRHSVEAKAKMSNGHRGYAHSDEHKRKISKSMRKMWKKRRQTISLLVPS